jgi:hypothetical protein
MTRALLALLLALGQIVAFAQDRPLERTVTGSLRGTTPHIYTVRAEAGDLIAGTFQLKAEPETNVAVALIDSSGLTIKEELYEGERGPLTSDSSPPPALTTGFRSGSSAAWMLRTHS